MSEQSPGEPIAYTALQPGTQVVTSDGTPFATVVHVLTLPSEDLFDGIVVDTDHGLRFVDRDQVLDITTARVRCALTAEQAAALPEPEGGEAFHIDPAQDTGTSLGARLGRLFGREHWTRDDR